MKHDPALQGLLRRVGVVESYLALVESLPGVAVVVTDAHDRVLLWSSEAERLFNKSGRQAVGARFLPPPTPAGTHHALIADGEHAGTLHLYVVPSSATQALLPRQLPGGFHGILSQDPAMFQVFQIVRNVAETDATVLVRGESGTGKELVARAIHAEGSRRDKPFIAVNCAAFTQTLLESELFGHVKGAFTGAASSRRGIFSLADGGTLFLDEVAELPLETQAKLLRVLQEQVFVPVGGTEPVQVDVRVIGATHRALREEVRAGRFREDLMYRLRVVPIFLPALRERRGDIELLLRSFVDRFNARGPRHVTRFSPEAMRALLDHPWPGNIRELKNVVEYAFAVGRGEELLLSELPPEFREAKAIPPAPQPAPTRAETPEAERILLALTAAQGDMNLAAQQLGVSRTTFWRMRKRAGM